MVKSLTYVPSSYFNWVTPSSSPSKMIFLGESKSQPMSTSEERRKRCFPLKVDCLTIRLSPLGIILLPMAVLPRQVTVVLLMVKSLPSTQKSNHVERVVRVPSPVMVIDFLAEMAT